MADQTQPQFDFSDPDVRQAYKDVFAQEHGFDLSDPDVNQVLDEEIDRITPPQPEKGFIPEVATQLVAGGVVEVPRSIGKALEYTGQPGDTLYEAGRKIDNWAAETERNHPWLRPTATEDSPVTKAFSEGARMVGPSLAVPAAVGLAASTLPVSGTIATLGAAGLGVIPMALQQGQDTLDKAAKAGVPYEDAVKAARGTAALEWAGETVAGYAGMKFLGFGGNVLSELGGRMLTKFGSASAAEQAAGKILHEISNPKVVPRFFKALAETTVEETGTEMAQGYTESAVEKAYGIDTQDPWEAAKQAAPPTLAMTALLAPFGLHASHREVARDTTVNALLNDHSADPEERTAAARLVHDQIKEVDPEAAKNWAANATIAIASDQPIALDRRYLDPPGKAMFGVDEENGPPPGPLTRAAMAGQTSAAPAPGTETPSLFTVSDETPAAAQDTQEPTGPTKGLAEEPGAELAAPETGDAATVSSPLTEPAAMGEDVPIFDQPSISEIGALDQLYRSKKQAQKVINRAILSRTIKAGEYGVVPGDGGWAIVANAGTKGPKPAGEEVGLASDETAVAPTTADTPSVVQPESPTPTVGESVEAAPADVPGAQTVTGPSSEAAPVVPMTPMEEIDAQAHEATTSPHNDLPQPTDAMKEAGNYQKGHVSLHGLDISIENPKGSVRSGVDQGGKEWRQTLKHHYGYFRGTIGPDKDHVDVFLGDKANDPSRPVFVVDQVDPRTGKYDEPKVVMGAADAVQARKIYLSNYEKGWQGIGAITPMGLDQFKEWVKDPAKTVRPVGDLKREGTNGSDQQVQAGLDRVGPVEGKDIDRQDQGAGDTNRHAVPAGDGIQGLKARAESRRLELLGKAFSEDDNAPELTASERKELSLLNSGQIGTWETQFGRKAALAEANEKPGTLPGEPAKEGQTQRQNERANTEQIQAGEGIAGGKTGDISADKTDNAVSELSKRRNRQSDATGKPAYGATNKLVTQERAEELRAKLRDKLTQFNSGIDPEMLAMGTELAVYHIEAGARSFAAFAKAMVNDLGDKAKPFLKSWYMGAKNWPGMDRTGMDAESHVDAAKVDDLVDKSRENTDDVVKGGDANERLSADSGTVAEGPQAKAAQGTEGQPRDGEDRRVLPGAGDGNRQADDGKSTGRLQGPDAGGKSSEVGSQGTDDTRPGGVPAQPRKRKPARAAESVRLAPEETNRKAEDYRITEADNLGKGGAKQKANDNLSAIRIIKQLQQEERAATAEEQEALVKYVGWGASDLANGMFPTRKWDSLRGYVDAYKEGWEDLSKEIHSLLTPEELAAAKGSTLNAHYTSQPIIKSMYAALERFGFTGGTILEPGSGPGHFIGLIPDRLLKGTRFTAIELDPITAGIAKALYPNHDVRHLDYAKFKAPDGFYDVAIGNPPFLDAKVTGDPQYADKKLSVHDFFFAKTIDKVRPGGMMIMITSRYTMDKGNEVARRYLGKSADLVGAIRLPDTAFKENAGTEVVTDVLFFRKRLPGDKPAGAAWSELKEVKTGANSTAWVNEYYADHPEMVLGDHSQSGSMYSANAYTVSPRPGDIETQFAKAVESMPAGLYRKANVETPSQRQTDQATFAPGHIKEGAFFTDDKGRLMTKKDGVGVAPEKLAAANLPKVSQLVKIRDAVRQVLHVQMQEGSTDADLKKAQKELSRQYDAFVAKFGPINKESTSISMRGDQEIVTTRYPNWSPFKADPDSYLVAAIEKYDPETGKADKADIFSKRTISPTVEPKIESLTDALHVVMHNTGAVDMAKIAELMGVSEAQAAAGLDSAVYFDPASKAWETSDEYLAGDVRKKLDEARQAAEIDKRYERNIAPLEAVQPEDLPPSRIQLSLGMPIIDPAMVEQFAKDEIKMGIKVSHVSAIGDWHVEPVSGHLAAEATSDYGTPRRHAADLISDALNSRTVKIFDYVRDLEGNEKKVVNKDATEAANAKLQKIQERFGRWMWEDADRTEAMVRRYNDAYNNTVKREYGGDHIHTMQFPGLSAAISPREHQKRVAWRIVQNGNTYMAHSVGAGKTIASIIAGQELKRLGIKKKPCWVVPGHMLKQFAGEFMETYPAAKILVADEEQFAKENRNRFMGRVAAENWDAVIITHSAFTKIPMDSEFQAQFIREQLDDLETIMLATDDRTKRKQIERAKKRLQARLDKVLADEGKDRGISFADSGIDQIFVDEAQEHRKLDFVTNQSDIKGIDPNGSALAFDLYAKSRYLESLYPGRSLVLMSGTPVTNTLGEVYTIQRFLQEPLLKKLGLDNFDAWASTFGKMVSDLQATPGGTYKMVSRFADFKSLPALSAMWAEIGDFVQAKDLPYIKRPEVAGGGRQLVAAEQSPTQKAYKAQLAERIKKIEQRKGQPKKGDDIILKVITDGNFAALDDRFINPQAPVDPNSKTGKVIAKVFEIWRDTRAERKTQMIFADRGMPGVEDKRGFSLYTHIKDELVKRGVPAEEIAFMQDYKKSDAKRKLFQGMNSGRVRVLIGSSQAMGTGVNAQERLVALHHLDPDSYLPANIEQREGRIVRQGNKNKTVQLYAYVTRGSYDETMWQFLESKQRFIDKFLAGQADEDTATDIDGMSDSFAVAKAMSSDNPLVLEKAGLENEIGKLRSLQRAHLDDQRNLTVKKGYAEAALPKLEREKARIEAAMAKRTPTAGDQFTAKVGRSTFDSRKEAGQALKEALATQKEGAIGSLGGGGIVATRDERGAYTLTMSLGGVESERVVNILPGDLAELDAPGLVMRLENLLRGYDETDRNLEAKIAQAKKQIADSNARVGARFEHAESLTTKEQRVAEIDKALADEGKKAEGAVETKQSEPTQGDTYRIKMADGSIERVPGTPHFDERLSDVEFFTYKGIDGRYRAYEDSTGMEASGSFPTRKEAIADLTRNIDRLGAEKLRASIDKADKLPPDVDQSGAPTFSRLDKQVGSNDNGDGGNHYGPGEITDRSRQLERALATYHGTAIPEGTITQLRLPDDQNGGRGKARRGAAAASQQGVLGGQVAIAQSIAKVFGKEVVFFHSSDPAINHNGVTIPGDTGVLFVNANAQHPFAVVTGHELLHSLRRDNQALYSQLEDVAWQELRATAYRSVGEDLDRHLAKEGKDPASGAMVIEEMLANTLGDKILDPAFWEKVAAKDKGLFERLAAAIKKFVQKVKNKLTNGLKSSDYYRDMERVENALADFVANGAKGDSVRGNDEGPLFSRRVDVKDEADHEQAFNDALAEVATEGTVTSKRYKQDTSVWARIFSTLEHYGARVPALKRYMDAVLGKDEIKHRVQNFIMGDNTAADFLQTLTSLQKSNPSEYAKLKLVLIAEDRNRDGYSIREESRADGTWTVYDPQGKKVEDATGLSEQDAIERMMDLGAAYAAEKGLSAEGVAAWRVLRRSLNNGFDIMADQMRKIISEARESNQEVPTVTVDAPAKHWQIFNRNKGLAVAIFESKQEAMAAMGDMKGFKEATESLAVLRRTDAEMKGDPKTEDISLSTLLAMMGQLRGTYMPRLRPPGGAVLIARKEGANPIRENFDLYRVKKSNDGSQVVAAVPLSPMARRIQDLKAQGYHVTLQKDESMSEDVFSAAKLVASTEAILRAGEEKSRARGGDEAYEAALMGIHTALNTSIANIFKGRGFRSTMIARNVATGNQVWLGYEEDPLKAVTQYARNMAGGIAKRDTARNMVLAITGRDISWKQFKAENPTAEWSDYLKMVNERRIDPTHQKNAYHDAIHHMEEFLRNEEVEDRVLGVMKGLAALKYMGFRVSSAAVNLTNMAAAVPATMKSIGGIPYLETWGHISKAAFAYGSHLAGKGRVEDRALFDEIHDRGWDEAQFNHEAAKVLQSKLGYGWDRFMSLSLAMFGATERVNRATTIYAAYKGIVAHNQDLTHDEAMSLAKEVSDKAHGVYGKATLPYMVQGKGPGQMMARSAYTFAKFSHNYLLTMHDLGWNKKDYLAAAHMLLSPVVMAGVGTSVITPIVKAIAKAFGGGDDPEEELYAWANRNFSGGEWLRSGLFGLGGRGVSLQGSLGINLLGFPTTLKDLLGAPFAVITDEAEAFRYAISGQGLKALEKALPAGLGNPIKAYREATDGVTTKTGAPVFYGTKPFKGTETDAVLRFFSFNPARMQAIKDIQWAEKMTAANFADARKEIYDRYRGFYIQPGGDRSDLAKIVRLVSEYNARVKESGRTDIPIITPKSVAMNMKRSFKPSKVERRRVVNE